jgi:hypothetical protein
LEQSLERSAEIKKPAGAVALIHSTPNTGGLAPSKVEVSTKICISIVLCPPRLTCVFLQDFDDDSDFLSSSPEPERNLQKQTGYVICGSNVSLFLLDTSISFQLFSVELDFSLNTARLFAPLLVGPPKNARAVLKSTLLFSHAAAAKLWSENLISIIVVARIKRQTQR